MRRRSRRPGGSGAIASIPGRRHRSGGTYRDARRALRRVRWESAKREMKRSGRFAKRICGHRPNGGTNWWVLVFRSIRWGIASIGLLLVGIWLMLWIAGISAGRRIHGLTRDMVRAAKLPFTGLGDDMRYFRDATRARVMAEAMKLPWFQPEQGATNGGSEMEKPGFDTIPEAPTNLRTVVESIHDCGTIGDHGKDGRPTLSNAHAYLYDLRRVMQTLQSKVAADLESTTDLVPGDGQSKDLLMSTPGVLQGGIEQLEEVITAWEQAEHDRLAHIYSDDPNADLLDHSQQAAA